MTFKPCHHIKQIVLLLFVAFFSSGVFAQSQNDTTKDERWNFHFQNTIIGQYHPSFNAEYSGLNSVSSSKETDISISSTAFLGAKLWNNGFAYLNPEIAGGNGFSQTTGIAAFPNGEVFRISQTAPNFSIARIYIRQLIALTDEKETIEEDVNQIKAKTPTSYIAINAGKFSVLDFFDDNVYSHDPRTQFYNWALMGNGAWDYPANTKGYTWGTTIELIKPQWAVRYCLVMVPLEANGQVMDKDISREHAQAIEYEHKYKLGVQKGTIRLVGFLNQARMGNYQQAISWAAQHDGEIEHAIDSVHKQGNTKYGFGINIEHQLSENVGLFMRASYNDGHNETWAFTEIDRAISLGTQLNGQLWTRKTDKLGIALLANGLSKDHRQYLADGGYGFIIGDGALSYRPEMIAEVYYSWNILHSPFTLSPDYQFIMNPGYNNDRGPVHAFGLRAHAAF